MHAGPLKKIPLYLLLAAASAGAGAEEPPEATFEQAISVLEVEVPVRVVRDGEPLRGLTAENFVVYDEGERREITSFRRIDLAEPSSADPAAAAAAAPGPGARRHFLIVFDFAFTEPHRVARAERAARSLVENLHPTDLVALAFFSFRRGGTVVLNFTSDHAQALTVLDGLAYLLGVREDPGRAAPSGGERDPLALTAGDWRTVFGDLGVAAGIEQSLSLEALEMIGDSGDSLGAFLQRNIFAHMTVVNQPGLEERQASFVTDLSDALRELASRAGSVGGLKHLVLLSQGFEGGLAEVTVGGAQQMTPGGGTWLLARLRETVELLRRDGWEMHAVSLGGLETGSSLGDGLFHLTHATGGALIERTNDAGAAVGRLLESRDVSYLLTFAAREVPAEGSYRRIRVELAGVPGKAKLVHRTAYRVPGSPPDADPQAAKLAVADLLAGRAEPAARLDVDALPTAIGRDRARVTVVVEIGAEALRSRREDGGLSLELYAYAFGGDGSIHAHSSRSLSLDRERADRAAAASGLKYLGTMELPAGSYELRCALRNAAAPGARAGLARLEVPDRRRAGAGHLVPVFLQPEADDWLVLVDLGAEPADAYPFTVDGRPMIPAARAALGDAAEARLLLLGYDLDLPGSGLRGRVVGESGVQEVTLSSRATSPPGGAGSRPELVLATFPVGHLPPGSYDLELTLPRPAGDLSASLSFRLSHE